MDICLYMSQNFGFVGFPDEFTTGSSIMPHKKNPDVFELIRAKCNVIQALPNDISLLTANLTSGYHRDLQILKEILFPAIENLKSCLAMANMMIQHIKINREIMNDDKYMYCFSVEEVNKLVLQGVPFRDAYQKVGKDIADGKFKPEKNVHHTHEGSIENLCTEEIRQKMNRIISSFQFEKVEEKIIDLLK